MERRLFQLLTESYVSELEHDWKSVPEEPIKPATQTDELQITDIFISLSGRFNTQQFDDFYWIMSKMQSEFAALMTRVDSRAFGHIFKKAQDEYKRQIITFDTMKDVINNEFNKRVFQERKGALAVTALALLLGKDRDWIYGIAEKTAILNQIESGVYYPFAPN